jgi:N-acetylmuramic acid 6-phosphate etherase
MAFQKITEQNSLHDNLDKKSVHDLLIEMNEEDMKVPLAVSRALPQIEELVEKIVERMKRGGRIFYLGAGTSGRLGVLDASEIPPTFGMPASLVVGLIAGGETALRNPVENAEDDIEKGWQELKERNVNGALRNARANGILTASVSCNPDSPIAQEAEIKIEAIVGPEFVTGSTRLKSGTAQKLILNMITTITMIKLGRVKGNKMVNMQLSNAKLVDRGARMIVEELGIDYEHAKNILLIQGSVKKAVDAFKLQQNK